MTTETDAKEFVITRVFDAPRDIVWKVWTDPSHLAHWWGPEGCTIKVSSLDFRPGGIFHYTMEWRERPPMWARFLYREMVPPEKLVFVNSFSDAEKNITRPPFSDNWPREILNVVTLTERGGKTELTLRGKPINATDEERRTFEEGFASMTQGFTGTFDKLAAYLAKL